MKRMSIVAAVVSASALALFVLAGAASAHVTISAPGATSGGSDQEITFRVPVEKNADTIGLKVQLPTDTPIASVDVLPVPGWTHRQTSVTLAKPIVTDDGDITEAVSEIDWTAGAGQGLTPGEFGAFTIIAGQLPDASSLTFKAIQLYSDGSQVDWTQTEAPGSTADLDNPAPVLTLAPAGAGTSESGSSGSGSSGSGSSGSGSSGSSATAAADGSTTSSGVVTASSSGSSGSSSDAGALVLGIVALIVALAALGLAVVSRARAAHPGSAVMAGPPATVPTAPTASGDSS